MQLFDIDVEGITRTSPQRQESPLSLNVWVTPQPMRPDGETVINAESLLGLDKSELSLGLETFLCFVDG